MFIIDRQKNEATSLERKSFFELNFKERANLQEWIDKNPDILGENLLIIQKEFDGFVDTNERLDLLALDADGNLVVIENKLDDSGRDVAWQALKYVSYASSLSKAEIRDIYQKYLDAYRHGESAVENLQSFFNNSEFDELQLNTGDQRIILVSAAFRKEVTSTVMWLLDHNVSIKCIKVTPYQLGEQIFLDTEQVLPSPDTEDFRIKLTNKKQEEIKTKEENTTRYTVRLKFWEKALAQLPRFTELYKNISPTRDNWINGASGISGISFNLAITQKSARVELYVGRPDIQENKRIFDDLYAMKDEIDKDFGAQLDWDRLEGRNGCRISHNLDDVSMYEEADWDRMIEFLGENIVKLHRALYQRLHAAVKKEKDS